MAMQSGKVQATGYWTFFCSPAKWAVDEFLSCHIEYDDYRVTNWQKDWFSPGQLGVIRVGADLRTKSQLGNKLRLHPGVYAIVEILDSAKPHHVSADRFWITETPVHQDNFGVKIRYLKNLIDRPVLLQDIKGDPQITDKYLLNGFQASSMPQNKLTFERILSYVGTKSQIFSNVELQSVDSLSEIQQLEIQYAKATPEVKERISKHIERGAFANKIKKANNFKCSMCDALNQNPISFIKRNGEPYIEIHHVIFVSELSAGVLRPSNLITVCPNHHRQLHYGNVELIENTADQFIFKIDRDHVKIKKLR